MENLILNINNKPGTIKQKEIISVFLQTIHKYKKNGNFNVNLHFISKTKIQELNYLYRNNNKPTDVLSFGQTKIPGEKIRELGDIFICLPIAKEQSKKLGNTLEEEIIFLANHGLKHLLGIHHKE